MRVQMRLSQESEMILRNEKDTYKTKEDITVTYGWLVNQIVKCVFAQDINTIDWEYVKSYKLKLVNELQENDCEYNTTLNLEKTVLEDINTMQMTFMDIFQASRVHKAFVIRMVLKSNYMLSHNININILPRKPFNLPWRERSHSARQTLT